MKKVAFLIFLFSFLILRPYYLQNSGLCYRGDDYSYFAHATSIVYGQFPSYENEYFDYGHKMPQHSIGSSLMAVPFVFAFSMIDRLQGNDIVEQRTKENIHRSWSMFGFAFATMFYFSLGCFLLYKVLALRLEDRFILISLVLAVFAQGIPLFAYRRPVFSHGYEFFLQSLMVYLWFNPVSFKKTFLKETLYWLGIIVALSFMSLVRLNNIPVAFFWLCLFLFKRYKFTSVQFWRATFFSVAGILFVIILIQLLPLSTIGLSKYIGKAKSLLQIQYFAFYVDRISHVIFGLDWGLLYTAPFIFIAMAMGVCLKYPGKIQALLPLIPMVFSFHLILVYLNNGSWYGYRYLIASITPLLVYPVAYGLKWSEEKYSRWVYLFFGLIAVFPLLSMLSFEGNNENLTLTLVNYRWGRRWGNEFYQLEVWKTLLFQPLELLIAIFKGGLLYVVYLLAYMFKLQAKLPAIVLDKYQVFKWSTVIKVGLIYTLPFLMAIFWKRDFFVRKKVFEA